MSNNLDEERAGDQQPIPQTSPTAPPSSSSQTQTLSKSTTGPDQTTLPSSSSSSSTTETVVSSSSSSSSAQGTGSASVAPIPYDDDVTMTDDLSPGEVCDEKETLKTQPPSTQPPHTVHQAPPPSHPHPPPSHPPPSSSSSSSSSHRPRSSSSSRPHKVDSPARNGETRAGLASSSGGEDSQEQEDRFFESSDPVTEENFPMAPPRVKDLTDLFRVNLMKSIGKGTYGTVFKASYLGSQVALKQINFETQPSSSSSAQPVKESEFPITAIREIKLLKELNALPNSERIVRLREVIKINEEPDKASRHNYFLMFELMDMDLSIVIKYHKEARKSIPPVAIKSVMKQLLEALRFCHRNKILHRDIKPANILLDVNGQLKLADFGLARKLLDNQKHYTKNVVTIWYRCPELLYGLSEYDESIDVWSVGCVFAEMLMGYPVLPGSSEIEQIAKMHDLCGLPNADEWPAAAQDYIRSIPPLPKPRTLREQLKKHISDDVALDLLARFMTLCPNHRISIDDALKHAYFNGLSPTDARTLGRVVAESKSYVPPTPPPAKMQKTNSEMPIPRSSSSSSSSSHHPYPPPHHSSSSSSNPSYSSSSAHLGGYSHPLPPPHGHPSHPSHPSHHSNYPPSQPQHYQGHGSSSYSSNRGQPSSSSSYSSSSGDRGSHYPHHPAAPYPPPSSSSSSTSGHYSGSSASSHYNRSGSSNRSRYPNSSSNSGSGSGSYSGSGNSSRGSGGSGGSGGYRSNYNSNRDAPPPHLDHSSTSSSSSSSSSSSTTSSTAPSSYNPFDPNQSPPRRHN